MEQKMNLKKLKKVLNLISVQNDVLKEREMNTLMGGNKPTCAGCLKPDGDPSGKFSTTESD